MAATQPSTSAAGSGHATPTAGAGASSASDSHSNPKASAENSPAPPLEPIDRTKDSFTKLMVERYTSRDAIAAAALSDQLNHTRISTSYQRQKINEYRHIRTDYQPVFTPGRLYGDGYRGYANGFTENHAPARIVYPSQKIRPGRRTTPALKYPRKDMIKQAELHEELVPVRIEVEWDKYKLRDTFTWNLHDRLLPVELFAAQLVEDIGVKPPAAQPVFEQIVSQMREQLTDFYPFVFSEEDALDPELPYSAYKNDEMRILVKLNITIGPHTLVDQFEWEINNPSNSPEEFAANMARDLSLSGEFTTAIAHCIREQSQLFTKSLYSVGHSFDGRPIEDSDLVSAFLQTPVPAVFRPQQQAKEYAPYMYEMSDADLDRNETIFSREQRRQKRSINRRGGPQLPDLRERQRTIRTLMVSSVLPGAAETIEETGLFKRAAGIRKRPTREGDISESDESDDSAPDSPAPSQFAGTARTRGMRGAASAAQHRMSNLGRSETPDALHHEASAGGVGGRSSRRFREETEDVPRLVVTLKVNKDKFRRLLRGEYRFSHTTPSQPPTPSQGGATPKVLAKAMPPTSTPSRGISTTPVPIPHVVGKFPPGQIGRLPAPPPVPGQQHTPPNPPEWLVQALRGLEKKYPDGDRFEAIMKYSYLDPITELPVQIHPLPDGVKYAWLPRIRCLDCTSKLYTPGPDMTAQKFETHLRFSSHREAVRARVVADGGGGGGGRSGSSASS
ncbi:SWI-SNF complex subunit [Cordyceps militaris]|uniref:SWI-SNF complex subunit n=1 Tax=Cordyceps militaris TaxID=73501 RepID=A0A2H4SCG4_CORMI|nr:SWI-SNF complex subunit [Cordyceps militaris]